MSRLPPPYLQRVDTEYGDDAQTGVKSFTFVFRGKKESLQKMERDLNARPDEELKPVVTLKGNELHVTKNVNFMDWVRVTKPGEPEAPQSILAGEFEAAGISNRQFQQMGSEIDMKQELLASVEARTDIDYRMKLEATTWPVQNDPVKRNPVVTITFDRTSNRSAVSVLQEAVQTRIFNLMRGGFRSSSRAPEITLHTAPEDPHAAQIKAESILKAVKEKLGLEKEVG